MQTTHHHSSVAPSLNCPHALRTYLFVHFLRNLLSLPASETTGGAQTGSWAEFELAQMSVFNGFSGFDRLTAHFELKETRSSLGGAGALRAAHSKYRGCVLTNVSNML